jgi:hypothetical protein
VGLACVPTVEPWNSQPERNTGSHIAADMGCSAYGTRVDDRCGRPAIWLGPRMGTAPAPEATSGASRSAAMQLLQRLASTRDRTPNRPLQCLRTLIDDVGGIGTSVARLERTAEEPGLGAGGRMGSIRAT